MTSFPELPSFIGMSQQQIVDAIRIYTLKVSLWYTSA